MKKWILSPLLLISLSVDAWGGRSYHAAPAHPTKNSSPETYFPLNADQGWFVEQSYLLTKTALGDLEYGDMVFQSGSSPNSQFKIKVKKPDFDWNSGFRLGVGRYLPNHDKWDVSFYTTYIYGDAEDRATGNLAQGKGLSTSYDPFVIILSEKTKAVWRLNYFTMDLMVGREFAMTSQISFHPYMGLRGALIYYDFNSKNFGTLMVPVEGQQILATDTAYITLKEDFWGLGAHLGSNFNYKFKGNWSFLGNFATSLLYGHYNVFQKSNTHFVLSSNEPLQAKASSKDHVIRMNLEAAVGMGWEKWMRQKSVRLAPNLQLEGSLWFDMNNFFKPVATFSQDLGTLGIMALTFNLQVDF